MLQMESYFSIYPSEAMKCVAFHNCSLENDDLIGGYLKLLDQTYNRYLNSVCSELNYCTLVTCENEKVDTLENQLLTFVKYIVNANY